jgi:hypothetical protein
VQTQLVNFIVIPLHSFDTRKMNNIHLVLEPYVEWFALVLNRLPRKCVMGLLSIVIVLQPLCDSI